MIQIIPGLAVFANYYLVIHSLYQNTTVALTALAVVTLLLLALFWIRKKIDVMDESAKQIMNRTNSLSFKWFFMYSGAVLVVVAFLTNNATVVGYMIAGGITATTVARAIIVYLLDGRGMQQI